VDKNLRCLSMSAIVPISRIPISVRAATMEDLPFIDQLQKKNTKMVGWMPTKQLEGKIKAGHVLIAEERHEGTEAQRHVGTEAEARIPSVPTCLRASVPVGYLIGNDQYFKRDDVGIVYQINIVESHRRSLVGAMLLKAQFERSAYGCRLYCCWCAQDIEANRFWEAMGFVALAFRAGSRGKGRVHIFWQKRIRSGDETTPWWFPAHTNSGSIREDRLVLPIPPGVRWWDEMPRVLPAVSEVDGSAVEGPRDGVSGVGDRDSGEKTKRLPGSTRTPKPESRNPAGATALGGWGFTPPAPPPPAPGEKTKRAPRQKLKNDPKLVAATRELKARWLEHVNEDPTLLLPNGKYDVARVLIDSPAPMKIANALSPLPLALPDSSTSTSSLRV
jgi:hypothetical protein